MLIVGRASFWQRSPMSCATPWGDQKCRRHSSARAMERPARQRARALTDRQIRHMTERVEGLLDVSRIRNGCLHLK